MTTGTLMVNFEDISMTLKEQSAEKVLGCVGEFTCTKSIFWKDENGGLPKAKITCPSRRWLRGHAIFELCYRKLKSFQNLLAWSAGAQEESFGQKKEAENLVTGSL